MLIQEQNENSIDIGVNTIFYVGDKKIKVVKSNYCDDCDCLDGCDNSCGYGCDNCVFYKRKQCIDFSCSAGDRKDKTDVVFLEQKEL